MVTRMKVAMKRRSIVSSAVGIVWFAVWLAAGAAVLSWALTHYRDPFAPFLPVFFIVWISALFLVRAMIAAIAGRQIHTALRHDRAAPLPDMIEGVVIYSAATNWGVRPQQILRKIEAIEKRRPETTEFKSELTELGDFALNVTLYIPQSDMTERLMAERFLRNAKDEYLRVTQEARL